MFKWIARILSVLFLASCAYTAYIYYAKGYNTLPDLPDGACLSVFDNGLRAIVLQPNVKDPSQCSGSWFERRLFLVDRERKYLAIALDVQEWMEDAWSWCKPPTDQDRARLDSVSEEQKRVLANMRFEAVCRVSVDGNEIERGLLFSVPRL